jgi:hypothetical protein
VKAYKIPARRNEDLTSTKLASTRIVGDVDKLAEDLNKTAIYDAGSSKVPLNKSKQTGRNSQNNDRKKTGTKGNTSSSENDTKKEISKDEKKNVNHKQVDQEDEGE